MTLDSRPIRLLYLISRLDIGGPTIHVTLLANRLGARDYECLVVCGSGSRIRGDMAYYVRQHGLEPFIMPELGHSDSPIKAAMTLWKLYRLITDFQPDVIHTQTPRAGVLGRMAAWLARVPVIVHTFHDLSYLNPPRRSIFLPLERIAARTQDTIITLNDHMRRELAETYHIARKRRVTVLPLGLDLAVFAQTVRKQGAFRQRWNIPDQVPLVGIVGRLAPVKNHDLFLRAAALVRTQLPEAHFVVVGDGESRPEAEALVETLELTDVVTFTGWQEDIPPLYSDIDLLVISSHNEGTPGSVIEALAAGCPVVATAVGGLPHLLDGGELGRLVAPGDASALAEAIVETLDNPPDTAAAQAAILDRYNIDRLVRDLDSLYRGLLTRKRRVDP
jgi:glycosyltransferase involved in cell wall biosynthesis